MSLSDFLAAGAVYVVAIAAGGGFAWLMLRRRK